MVGLAQGSIQGSQQRWQQGAVQGVGVQKGHVQGGVGVQQGHVPEGEGEGLGGGYSRNICRGEARVCSGRRQQLSEHMTFTKVNIRNNLPETAHTCSCQFHGCWQSCYLAYNISPPRFSPGAQHSPRQPTLRLPLTL